MVPDMKVTTLQVAEYFESFDPLPSTKTHTPNVRSSVLYYYLFHQFILGRLTLYVRIIYCHFEPASFENSPHEN